MGSAQSRQGATGETCGDETLRATGTGKAHSFYCRPRAWEAAAALAHGEGGVWVCESLCVCISMCVCVCAHLYVYVSACVNAGECGCVVLCV